MTHNFVYELTRRPFNLTATVVSNLNLTSLHWSPEYPDQSPSRTITVCHGNITTTAFMLLRNATLGDSGNYTLTAANECGENSSKVDVEVLIGKIIANVHTHTHARTHARTHTHTHTHTHIHIHNILSQQSFSRCCDLTEFLRMRGHHVDSYCIGIAHIEL